MSLLEEAREEQRVQGPVCSAGTLLKEDKGELAEAFAAVALPKGDPKRLHAAALERALAKRNIVLKSDTIRRHIDKRCSCVAA